MDALRTRYGGQLPGLSRSPQPKTPAVRRHVMVIGGSAGAITALKTMFANLAPDLPAAIGVVVHPACTPRKPARARAVPIHQVEGAPGQARRRVPERNGVRRPTGPAYEPRRTLHPPRSRAEAASNTPRDRPAVLLGGRALRRRRGGRRAVGRG